MEVASLILGLAFFCGFLVLLSAGACGLDGTFDKYKMYCNDCKREFTAKNGSLLGSDSNTYYINCTHCNGTNTILAGDKTDEEYILGD